MTDVQSRSGIDRRTVVKTGVATAWSVPLVQAVAASPAFAVSGPANLSSTSGTIDRSSGTYTIAITVRNTGGSATQALTATITSSSAPIQSPTTPTGWSGTSPTYTANAQVAAGGTTTFNMTFTVPTGHIGKANTVTVNFTTGGTGAVSGSVSRTF